MVNIKAALIYIYITDDQMTELLVVTENYQSALQFPSALFWFTLMSVVFLAAGSCFHQKNSRKLADNVRN